jgi:hypothetical protein
VTIWSVIAFTPQLPDQSPNVSARDVFGVVDTYVAATIVAFASLARWVPGGERVLVTDAPEHFDDCDAELLVRPFDAPVVPIGRNFTGALYLVQAMREIAPRVAEDDVVLFLDPDCLVTGSVDPIVELARRRGAAAYPLDLPPDGEMQSLTRLQARILHEELDGEPAELPVYYGGECYAFTGSALPQIAAAAGRADEMARRAARLGEEVRFRSQEHFLNYALARHGQVGDLSPWVRRIWTGWQHRNVTGDEVDGTLVVWHLPGEKGLGFPNVRRELHPGSWFWTATPAEFRRRAARAFGVVPTPTRRAGDIARRSWAFARRVSGRLARPPASVEPAPEMEALQA